MRKVDFNWSIVVCLAAPALALRAVAATAPDPTDRVSADHVAVELIAENNALKPGARAWVGIKFTHDPHWHTYWMNPGDSGLPTRLAWQLPNGFRAGEIAWPAPRRFDLGDLYNFGFEGIVLLPVPIDVPASAKPNQNATLTVIAKWLVCNDVCIPGRAEMKISVPVANSDPVANPGAAALFADARAALPTATKVQGQAVASTDRVVIELRGMNLPAGADLDAFPTAAKLLGNTPFKVARDADRLVLTAQKSEYFETAPAKLSLVIVQKNKAKERGPAWQVEIPWNTQRSGAAK
jgi:thiol:disulfide interchange protein DsbD